METLKDIFEKALEITQDTLTKFEKDSQLTKKTRRTILAALYIAQSRLVEYSENFEEMDRILEKTLKERNTAHEEAKALRRRINELSAENQNLKLQLNESQKQEELLKSRLKDSKEQEKLLADANLEYQNQYNWMSDRWAKHTIATDRLLMALRLPLRFAQRFHASFRTILQDIEQNRFTTEL